MHRILQPRAKELSDPAFRILALADAMADETGRVQLNALSSKMDFRDLASPLEELSNLGLAKRDGGRLLLPDSRKADDVPLDQLIALWHEIIGTTLGRAVITESRKSLFRARWKDLPSLDDWRNLLNAIQQSDFLCGRKKDFRATLGWVLKRENFVKILEGAYDNHRPQPLSPAQEHTSELPFSSPGQEEEVSFRSGAFKRAGG